jgi:copper chaperone CopZ
MCAIDSLRDVYGIRRVVFNEKEKTVRVEYDATRLQENVVAALLRRAGINLGEKLALA